MHCLPPLCPLLRLDGLCDGRGSRAHCAQAQLWVDGIVILLVGVGLISSLMSFEERRHSKIRVVMWSFVKTARVGILPPRARTAGEGDIKQTAVSGVVVAGKHLAATPAQRKSPDTPSQCRDHFLLSHVTQRFILDRSLLQNIRAVLVSMLRNDLFMSTDQYSVPIQISY